MQIEIQKNTIKGPQNQYVINIKTYYGDADGYSQIQVTVKPDKIKQIIAEILFVKHQFPNGRGGRSDYYDQTNYFGMSDEAWESQDDDTHDGYWTWFDQEWGDYPYSGDYEQNYTLDRYEVLWYDASGTKHAVEIKETHDLIADIQALNREFKIGDSQHWGQRGHSYYDREKPEYQARQAELRKQYHDYRVRAIEIVNKHSSVD